MAATSTRPNRFPDDPPGVAGDLVHYLRNARDAVLRAVDGVGEHDARRPLTPSATNLLGVVKHLVGVESAYLGDCVGRPSPVRPLPWDEDGSVWEGGDMWLRADESRAWVLDLYAQVAAHTEESVRVLPLDAPASVPWWGEDSRGTTFGELLVRVTAETAQHAGHLEILREQLDGQAGRDREDIGDPEFWQRYVAAVDAAAEPYRGS